MTKVNLTKGKENRNEVSNTKYYKYLKTKFSDEQINEIRTALLVIKNASKLEAFSFEDGNGCLTESANDWAKDLYYDVEESLTGDKSEFEYDDEEYFNED